MSKLKIKGILSYPNIFIAKAINPGDDPKFTASLLILKTDPQVPVIQAAIEAVKLNGFPSGFPASGKTCLHDCAVKFPDDPTLANYMVLTAAAKANKKPIVVDMNVLPVMSEADAYAGVEVWFSVNIYSYDMPVSKGVTSGLNGVMVTGVEGALGHLGNEESPAEMFAGIAGTAPPQAAAAGGPSPTITPAPNSVPAPTLTPTPTGPTYVMTAAAQGNTREALIGNGQGWTDELLIAQGMMIASSV